MSARRVTVARFVGARVRARRLELELTQDALAVRTPCRTATVSDVERGVRLPTLDTLFALAIALDAPVIEFVP